MDAWIPIVGSLIVMSFAFIMKLTSNNKVKRKDCDMYRKEIVKKLDKVADETARIAGFLEAIYNKKIE